ncbi:hypothetical protein IPZ58_11130 [Streptomyces roseoverticillatus]|uniref:hypothetical protein n=1 Tax=Streptomyces roseoverticillatus TaxID=66429 RepID=UPI001F348F69|nr:hypothetical protein [Streptomyces roseoverticillatus]MCF3102137.1 hypothetical protein [Streptomyces roseoverticillatus]
MRASAETGLRLTSGIVLLTTGSDGVLLHCRAPVAAYVPPAAMNWAARGAAVPAEHAAAYARCLEAWRSVGLLEGTAPQNSGEEPLAGAGASRAHPAVDRPVLVIVSSPGCGYCLHLRADLEANREALARLDASVLLVGDGSPAVWGSQPAPGRTEELAEMWADVARLGTPSAVLLVPGDNPRILRGFDAVTAALIELGGGDPGRTVCELPTSCSATVGAGPVDTLVTVHARGRTVGVAARGPGPVSVVAGLVAEKSAPGGDTGYVPVTLRVERPRNVWLIFRGGELVARSRSAEETLSLLRRIIAGFGPPEAHQSQLLCGALVQADGRAVLVPRNWFSYFVVRSSLLAKSGWRPCPDPYVLLEAAPGTDPDGAQPVLVHPSPDWDVQRTPVTGALAQPPDRPRPEAHTRGRALAAIVNWLARPASPQQLRAAYALVSGLPVHLGTREESLTFLTVAATDAEVPS